MLSDSLCVLATYQDSTRDLGDFRICPPSDEWTPQEPRTATKRLYRGEDQATAKEDSGRKEGGGDLLGDRSAKPSQGPSTVLPSAAEVQAPQVKPGTR